MNSYILTPKFVINIAQHYRIFSAHFGIVAIFGRKKSAISKTGCHFRPSSFASPSFEGFAFIVNSFKIYYLDFLISENKYIAIAVSTVNLTLLRAKVKYKFVGI